MTPTKVIKGGWKEGIKERGREGERKERRMNGKKKIFLKKNKKAPSFCELANCNTSVLRRPFTILPWPLLSTKIEPRVQPKVKV